MRPLAAIIGIMLGSALAIFTGLLLTLVVLWFLPEFHDRLAGEFRPLVLAIAWMASLTLVAAVAFYAELRRLSWRTPAQLGLVVALLAVGSYYWPK